MRNLTRWIILVAALAMVVGCTPVRTKTPLTSCPLVQKAPALDNGAIFQAAANRPLFEDRHARNVGDELTITLGEVTAQTQKSSKNAGKSEAKADLPSKGEKAGGSESTSAFSGEIIATVIVVMDNGKLLVCGDKLVKYANGETNFEYIRFSGTVNPDSISERNTVLSTQVADVQIEYRNASNIDSPNAPPTLFSRLSRFFAPKKLYF
jgi:flagellar L-ring protein precursor FlgH